MSYCDCCHCYCRCPCTTRGFRYVGQSSMAHRVIMRLGIQESEPEFNELVNKNSVARAMFNLLCLQERKIMEDLNAF